jgi:hypothetical protein
VVFLDDGRSASSACAHGTVVFGLFVCLVTPLVANYGVDCLFVGWLHLDLRVFGSKNYHLLGVRSRLHILLGDLGLVTRYADLPAAVVGPVAITFRRP